MKIEFIKASDDCFNQVTGFCYHYPTIWGFLLVAIIIIILLIGIKFISYWTHESGPVGGL